MKHNESQRQLFCPATPPPPVDHPATGRIVELSNRLATVDVTTGWRRIAATIEWSSLRGSSSPTIEFAFELFLHEPSGGMILCAAVGDDQVSSCRWLGRKIAGPRELRDIARELADDLAMRDLAPFARYLIETDRVDPAEIPDPSKFAEDHWAERCWLIGLHAEDSIAEQLNRTEALR